MEKCNFRVAVLVAKAQESRCVSKLSLDLNAVAGQAFGLAASKRLLKSTDPDVAIVVMNGSVAHCLRFVRGLTQSCDIPVLVVSSRDESLYAERALRAGARGYLMTEAPPEALVAAIHTVGQGDVYLSDKAKAKVLNGFRKADWKAGGEP